MVEITDEDGAKLWLEPQRHEVCVAMAVRAALRIFPGLGTADDERKIDLALPVMRAILTAGVVCTCPRSTVHEFLYPVHHSSVSVATAKKLAAFSVDDPAEYSVAASMCAVDAARFSSLDAVMNSAAVADASTRPAPFSSAKSAWGAFSEDATTIDSFDELWTEGAWWIDPIFGFPLWRTQAERSEVAVARNSILKFLDADPAKWDFWARWYRGMFAGHPMGWALQRAVALIPDDVWQAGPEAVAKRIAEIEVEFAPMPPEAARAQAQVLLLRPQITVLQANGLRELIDRAVDEYRREVCNQLPDCLKPLENLPVILHQIAETAGGDAPITDKEAALMRLLPMMAGTISDLNRRLQAAQADKATGDPDKRRLFHDAFYGRLGERSAELITSRTLWGGGLMLGASVFLGLSVSDLQAGLTECYEHIIRPEAGSERWPPPPPQFGNPLEEA